MDCDEYCYYPESLYGPDSSEFSQSTTLHISPGYKVYPAGISDAVAFPELLGAPGAGKKHNSAQ